MSHYIPTKMGIIGFMRGLANDVANDGVTANAMDNSPLCFPQRVEKGIYNSESAEDVDFEFAPDSVKRQYLQGAVKHRASCVQAGRSPDTFMANADSHCNAPTKGVIAQKCRRMRSQLRC